MGDLYKTSDLVHSVLKQDEQARNSDNYLYFKIIAMIGAEKGIDIHSMSIPTFLLKMKDYGFPAFETVRRSRQKIQHDNPELAGCDRVEAQRELNEEVFREYARS